MFVWSNAWFISQADLVQKNRWEHGQPEFVLVEEDEFRCLDSAIGSVTLWNSSYEGGKYRHSKRFELPPRILARVEECRNPNFFLVLRRNSGTPLHAMLSTLLPRPYLERYDLEQIVPSLWLTHCRGEDNYGAPGWSDRVEAAFSHFIWTRLLKGSRHASSHYSSDFPVKTLCGDPFYWMQRLYRLALERYEKFAEAEEKEGWDSLEFIEGELSKEFGSMPEDLSVRRPREGGTLWDHEDAAECDSVVEELISGAGVMESATSLVDLILSHSTHEDFSEKHSWIRQDFERAFYSKRSKNVKVVLASTLDNFPVDVSGVPTGYESALFRDVLSSFDPHSRRLLIALRHGHTTREMADAMHYKSHSFLSQRLGGIRRRVAAILQD